MKKIYLPPLTRKTVVVLEQGLCTASNEPTNVTFTTDVDSPLKVEDYTSIGDANNDHFNDITFD